VRKTRAGVSGGVAVVMGTRPEVIKLAPVVRELARRRRRRLAPRIILTGQHREMADEVLRVFRLRAHHDLHVMRPEQTLFQTTSAVLQGLERVFRAERPAAVLVQGDTTSTLAGALAAFYLRIPVGHVEAGLRTYDRWNPYPEEMNRRLTSSLADFHFAPTARARRALLAEGIPSARIFVTGNTVVDALQAIARQQRRALPPALRGVDGRGRRLVVVTAHRRESWGAPLAELAAGLREIAAADPRAVIVFPVHPNPNVMRSVRPVLEGVERVHLIPPLDYASFVHLMARSTLIITDSGGIQEEAPSLGKPVLVVRRTSERPEGVEAGMVRLVGTDRRRLVREALALLGSPAERARMVGRRNPYGDGRAAVRIVNILERELEGTGGSARGAARGR